MKDCHHQLDYSKDDYRCIHCGKIELYHGNWWATWHPQWQVHAITATSVAIYLGIIATVILLLIYA